MKFAITNPLYTAKKRHRIDSYPPYRCPKWRDEAESDLSDLSVIETSENHPRFIAIQNCIDKTERKPGCGVGTPLNRESIDKIIERETSEMKAEHKSEEEIAARSRSIRASLKYQ